MKILQLQEAANLSEKEAKVYLTALTLGVASIAQLAQKSGLKRPNTYIVVEALTKKHLLIKTFLGKKIIYQPENPDFLVQNWAHRHQAIRQIIPQLFALYNTKPHKPKICFYEGKEAIMHGIQEEMFRCKEIWAAFSFKKFLQVFSPKDNEHFFRILVRAGGFIYDLLEDTPEARRFSDAKYRSGISAVKFLPKEMQFSTDLMVYGNKLALISFDNICGTVIVDQSIAHTQKLLLQFIWKLLPEPIRS